MALLVLTVAMMILPVPTLLADILIALNIGLSMVLMMVVVYIRTPVEFSTLPAVILITTAFRLSLSITTSRMVLVQADAGDIIRTFGEFVIAGNVLVGMVVYLIITIVQFVVITKGSERVAEVAARFSLDALPGRQISIDTDLKNGDIAQDEARRRRTLLQKESQLYGAMDGAMKFVKGDAIASLIVIIINLLGGISIGCLQHGMAFSEAVRTYSLLAVGDGLIAQIPALLISLTAGVLVTRVTSEAGSNLGHDIVGQLASEPRTLQVAAVVLAALSLVPGFPAAVFLCFSAMLAGIAWLLVSRRKRDVAVVFADEAAKARTRPLAVAVVLHIGNGLEALRPKISRMLEVAGEDLASRLGISIPLMRLADANVTEVLSKNAFRICVDAVPSFSGEVAPQSVFVDASSAEMDSLAIAYKIVPGPFGSDSIMVAAAEYKILQNTRLSVVDAVGYVCRSAEKVLLLHAGRLIGIQETQNLLSKAAANFPELVREVTKVCPLPRMSDVMRLLVEEQVPLVNFRQALEAVAEWAPREATTQPLVEQVRSALKRQICYSVCNSDMTIIALGLEADLETRLRPFLQSTPQGIRLEVSQLAIEDILKAVHSSHRAGKDNRLGTVVLTSHDLRRPLYILLRMTGLEARVIAYNEIAPEFFVKLIGTIRANDVRLFPESLDRKLIKLAS